MKYKCYECGKIVEGKHIIMENRGTIYGNVPLHLVCDECVEKE